MLKFRVLFLLLVSTSAFAFESRFEIDPAVNTAQLAASGQTRVGYLKRGGTYVVDASAVFKGSDFDKLARLSADYDHYVELGMPNLKESRIVARSGQDILFTYSHMSTSGQTSKHYLEVRLHPFGAEWQLTPKQTGWAGTEDSAFKRLDGSWYMERIDGSDQIYVRYFLAAVFDTGIPDFLVELVARRQLSDGVRQVVAVLGARSKR